MLKNNDFYNDLMIWFDFSFDLMVWMINLLWLPMTTTRIHQNSWTRTATVVTAAIATITANAAIASIVTNASTDTIDTTAVTDIVNVADFVNTAATAACVDDTIACDALTLVRFLSLRVAKII